MLEQVSELVGLRKGRRRRVVMMMMMLYYEQCCSCHCFSCGDEALISPW